MPHMVQDALEFDATSPLPAGLLGCGHGVVRATRTLAASATCRPARQAPACKLQSPVSSLQPQPTAGRGWRALLRIWLLIGFACQCLVGCSHNMHRRMTIRSDPPGALVLLEGKEIGYTPVGIDFDHYGTRELTLIKDGYETVTAMQKVRSPWYQKVPLDLVSDNFSPVKINDRTDYTFTLNKQELVSNEQLLQRGGELRSKAQVLPKTPGD